MSFLAPLWLAGLLPWAAVTFWLLRGRVPPAPVPFVRLWRGELRGNPPRHSLERPPWPMAMAMGAMLLAVLAAARPVVHAAAAARDTNITIVVDRGLTMSPQAGGTTRFSQAAAEAAAALARELPAGQGVDLHMVPESSPRQSTIDGWASVVRSERPAAADSKASLQSTVAGLLKTGAGPVVLISDQRLGLTDDRLIQIPPQAAVHDVAIEALAVREPPHAQAMVSIRNASTERSAVLTVESAGALARETLDLPPAGELRSYFVDLASVGPTVAASIGMSDDCAANNKAWVVRRGQYPRLELLAPAGPALERMIAVYGASRPPARGSRTVSIVACVPDVPPEGPSVVIGGESAFETVSGPVVAADHPLSRGVNWSRLPAPIHALGHSPKGWTPIVTVGGTVLVAAREPPAQQVWVGFDTSAWAGEADYVVLWANVFDWAGQVAESFEAETVSIPHPDWSVMAAAAGGGDTGQALWPGLYRTPQGIRALNAPPVQFAEPRETGWRDRIRALRPGRVGVREGSSALALAALACLAAAAAGWKRPNLTAFSGNRKFLIPHRPKH